MTSLAARILTHYYCERLAAKLPLNLEKVRFKLLTRSEPLQNKIIRLTKDLDHHRHHRYYQQVHKVVCLRLKNLNILINLKITMRTQIVKNKVGVDVVLCKLTY